MSDTQTIQDVEQQFTTTYNASQQTVKILSAFKTDLEESKVFDQDDINAVQAELERFHNQDVERYRQLSLERLRVLKIFDEQLNFSKNHPVLNGYFVKKQQEIMKVLASAGN
jgi:hypothetical protein